MSKSKIEWTDAVWNPVSGCTKVSEGCAHCYAERMSKRLAGRCGYPKDNPFRVTLHPDKLEDPLKWKKPRRIFVNSMSDLFHEDVSDEFIFQVFNTMANAAWICGHTFMVLTKRPERMKRILEAIKDDLEEQAMPKKLPNGMTQQKMTFPFPLRNIWLGVSVENQAAADERIPLLLQTPAAVRFISAEPLLGPLDLRPWITRYYHGGKPKMKEESYLLPPSETGKPTLLQYSRQIDPNGVQQEDRVYLTTDYSTARLYAMGYPNGGTYRAIPDLPLEDDPDCLEKGLSFQTPQARIVSMNTPILNWVITGGESGPGARPMHPDWVRSLRNQCLAASVPFFFKQWGEWLKAGECGNEADDTRCYHVDNIKRINHNGGMGYHGAGAIYVQRIGKKYAGRELDGQTWDEIPEIGGKK